MTTVMRRIPPLLAFALGIALCTPPSWGQTQVATEAQRANDLEEVVVTARMRDETFQAVPITMNVFTAQTIQDAGIETPRDFIGLVPNMTMVETQNVGNSFVTIRGISQARNSEPSVAVLVDGVLQTNPYEFNEELYDLKQIEVLKGPQGALYGRNAIGGAIIVHTADPSDHFEASTRLGVGNGVSERVQAVVSGPIDSAGTLRYRASGNYYNTDGYTNNSYLNQNADPFKEYSGRLRLLWKPTDRFTGDLRVYYDQVETTAFYFVIPRSDEANPFSDFSTPANANDTSSPIQNNNLGMADRDIIDTALKLDFDLDYGVVTSVTDYNHTKEIDTGDAYDFRPVANSVMYFSHRGRARPSLGGPFDESQSQYIDVTTWSQELRFTAPKVNGFSWIAGAYYLHTDRFISTGNLVDRGLGVPAVYHDPIVDPTNPFATNTNQTFLADTQNNNAWALFGDATYAFAPQVGARRRGALRPGQPPEHDQYADRIPAAGQHRPGRLHGPGAQCHLQQDPAQGHPALHARRQPDALRWLESRVPQRWVQPDRCGRGGSRQRRAGSAGPVPGRNSRYLRSRRQEPMARPQAFGGCRCLLQPVDQWLFLRLHRRKFHAEPRQSRRGLQGSRALDYRATHGSARSVCQLRLHRQQYHQHGRPLGDRQPGAAGVEGHHQRRDSSTGSRSIPDSAPRCAWTTARSGAPGGSRTTSPRAIRSRWWMRDSGCRARTGP